MKTISYKGHNGWRASTEIDLSNSQVLTISTIKTPGGALTTRAFVSKSEGGFLHHIIGKDYSRYVQSSNPSRITEKAVLIQHNNVLEQDSIDAIKVNVEVYYLK